MKGLELLASLAREAPDISLWSWATVTAIAPLRVRLDGESTALAITPDALISGLAVGDRVWVQLVANDNPARRHRRLVIIGASPRELTARKTSEPQNNTATLADDGQLLFTPPLAGTRWELELWGGYGTVAGQDFQCAFDTNTGAGNGLRWTVDAPSLADVSKPAFNYIFDANSVSLGRSGTFTPLRIRGVYTAVTTATLHFRWAQNTGGAGPTFVMVDTFLKARMIA